MKVSASAKRHIFLAYKRAGADTPRPRMVMLAKSEGRSSAVGWCEGPAALGGGFPRRISYLRGPPGDG
jgi:hypothetical protein